MLSQASNRTYFGFYGLVFVIYGCVVTSIGPLIPFFAQKTGQHQTYFSFIFFSRAIGYIFGGSFIKYLTQRFNYHHIYIGLLIGASLSFILSSLSLSFLNLAIWMFSGAACCCMVNVVSNLCVFKLFIGENQDFWVQLLHLLFGVGGLIGPFIVVFTHQNALFFIGILFILVIPPFFSLKSPQVREEARKSTKGQLISFKAELSICFLFLLYIGIEVGFASWIPTYAIQTQIANPQQASILSSIFWITNTIFRIILLYVPGTVTFRLHVLLRGLAIGTIILFLIQQFDHFSIAAYLGVFTIGMFLSSMYALFLSVVQQYGFILTPFNTANFMMAASLGEGVLIMPMGYLMGIFGPKALIIIALIMALAMWLTFEFLVHTLRSERQTGKQLGQELILKAQIDRK